MEGSDPVCVHALPSIPLNWRKRGSDSEAKDISGFSHICSTQPPRSVRERGRLPCQEDSRLLISGNRLAVPPSIVIE